MMSGTMTDKNTRILVIEDREVQCLPGKRESVEKCRFCVHSKRFREAGIWKVSPARAYCTLCKSNDAVNIDNADAVECDDINGEGYRSILNIIS